MEKGGEKILKKKAIISLIKYHIENNDIQFRNTAVEIAQEFQEHGDNVLAEYIMGLLTTCDVLVPQSEALNSSFFRKVQPNNSPLPLPKAISEDIKGIINAVNHHVGFSKFLFVGSPGTGKTESVKQVARLLDRQLYQVEFSSLIDSKLGQTAKNVVMMFSEINKISDPSKVLILFDEIDAIALDRINSNDLREMGRVTSTILKEMDNMNDAIVLIATTNLFKQLDKALIRRFDSVINFDRYERDDLIEISGIILNYYLKKFKMTGKDLKLFKKIIRNYKNIPNPGELKNLIRVSLAFSDTTNDFDYLRRLVKNVVKNPDDVKELHNKGFTIREIAVLTNISKSQVSRELKVN